MSVRELSVKAQSPSAKDAKGGEKLDKKENALSFQVIGAALEVHRHLGPGLLESAYRDCLCRELAINGIKHERERVLPISYKGVIVTGYRADIIVEDLVILELKSVQQLHPVHAAQLLSYLRASGLRLGLLINFNEVVLRNGIVRLVNRLP